MVLISTFLLSSELENIRNFAVDLLNSRFALVNDACLTHIYRYLISAHDVLRPY